MSNVGTNTGPKISTDPIELLTPDLCRPEPFINKYFGGFVAGALFWSCMLFTNYMQRRPVFSNVPWQLLTLGGGAVGGQYFDEKRKVYLSERDAVLRHYVQLHPEDFPAAVRQKYADILLPWQPIR